jgi:hypothetical protein
MDVVMMSRVLSEGTWGVSPLLIDHAEDTDDC